MVLCGSPSLSVKAILVVAVHASTAAPQAGARRLRWFGSNRFTESEGDPHKTTYRKSRSLRVLHAPMRPARTAQRIEHVGERCRTILATGQVDADVLDMTFPALQHAERVCQGRRDLAPFARGACLRSRQGRGKNRHSPGAACRAQDEAGLRRLPPGHDVHYDRR